jgi:hypothetical protein
MVGALKSVLLPAAAYALTLVDLTAFRVGYFGHPLPNTYYAKVSPSIALNLSDGLKYLSRYFQSNPIIAAAVLSVVLGLTHEINRWRSTRRPAPSILLPGLGLVGLLIPVLTGGDHYPSHRFYQPMYPILLLSLFYFAGFVLPQYLAISWRPQSGRGFRRAMFVSVALAVLVFQVGHWQKLRKEATGLSLQISDAVRWGTLGRLMTDTFSNLPRFPSIGVATAGAQKYHYEGDVIDLLGLTNVRMAHNGGLRMNIKNHAAFERETFYELLPDIVYPVMRNGEAWVYSPHEISASFGNFAFKGLFFDERFQELYIFTRIARKNAGDNRIVIAFVSRDYIKRLTKDPRLNIETFAYDARG